MPSTRLLENRLCAHFATLRSYSPGAALKRSAGNWQIYAAVTGSALAMATNASAGIIYSGPEDIAAGPVPNVASSTGGFTFRQKTVSFIKGTRHNRDTQRFEIKASQISTHRTQTGRASLIGGGLVGFLHKTGSNPVKMLASGAKISAGAGKFSFAAGPTYSHVGFEHHAPGGDVTSGWPVGEVGFAGFEFGTKSGTMDYGWIELEYLEGSNGLADEIEVLGVAYDNTGSAIQAGELPASSTPEPSTAAMAILAAGAAGVEALRRRRKAAV